MAEQYQKVIQYAKENHELMVQQLHDLCNINSGSENLNGLRTVHQALFDLFKPISDNIETIPMKPVNQIDMNGINNSFQCGDALLIQKRPELKRRILLAGHMDTVFGVEHPFQKCQYIENNVVNGPGVADMKGGLLVILHAVTAFESLKGTNDIGWDLFINADEEIGSFASGEYLKLFSTKYDAGLIYEPAMTPDGCLAKNRKGSGKLTLIAKGIAAHAGRAFYEGKNAIYHLSRAICDIQNLNGQRDGVTINIGKILGGEALNVVPDKAVAKLDIRISSPEDELWVRNAIQEIIKSIEEKGYELKVHGDFSRPVKRVNQATVQLFNRIQSIGQKLDLNIEWKDSGGCCDGNNLAQYGMPVIDTLGVRGGNIHSGDEYILLDSLIDRTILSGLILQDLALGGLELLRKN